LKKHQMRINSSVPGRSKRYFLFNVQTVPPHSFGVLPTYSIGTGAQSPRLRRLELEADSLCRSGQDRGQIYLPHVSCAETTFRTLSVFAESNLVWFQQISRADHSDQLLTLHLLITFDLVMML